MNKEYPLISIVIPTYNSEKFLKECFDSVVNQTYPNLEVIIVDGGSTDSTISIIKTYLSNSNWFLFESKKGVSRQRNLGLKNVHGEYIFFLDSDDYINEKFIENLYKYLVNNNLDVVTPEIVTARCENNKITETNVFVPKIRNDINKDNFFIDGYDSLLAGPTKLYKSSLLKDIWFKENLAFGEDYLFNYDVSLKYSFKFDICHDSQYFYRKCVNETSLSKRMNKDTIRFFPLLLKIVKKLDKKSQNYKDACKLLKDDTNLFMEEYVKAKRHIPSLMNSTRWYFFINDHSQKRWFYLFPKKYIKK